MSMLIFSHSVEQSFDVKDIDVGTLSNSLQQQIKAILASSPTVNITVTRIECRTVEHYKQFFSQVPKRYTRMAPSYGYPMEEKKKMLTAYYGIKTSTILDFTLGDCNDRYSRN